jgi:hypothetical protein
MKRLAASVALCALLFAISCPGAPAALAADYPTGDLAGEPANVTTVQEVLENAAFEAWAARLPNRNDAPFAYLATRYCPQLRSYWCGPAAVQTALTYFGDPPAQATIATRLSTTSNGTAMSRVDDALRYYTARPYTYHNITSVGDFNAHVEYAIGAKRRPMIVDVRIQAPWGPYRLDHAGHIICVDGFNWTPATIRVNDSYDEHAWQSGGGATGGPTNYDRGVLFTGVWRHSGHPIVF